MANKFGDSAWFTLMKRNDGGDTHLGLIKLFLEKGADANKPFEEDEDKRYPIHFAATKEYMDLLMNHKADINSVDITYRTVLFMLDRLAPEKMIMLLKHAILVHHADVNAQSFDKSTILTKCITTLYWNNDGKDVVDFLIAHGADVNHILSVTIL